MEYDSTDHLQLTGYSTYWIRYYHNKDTQCDNEAYHNTPARVEVNLHTVYYGESIFSPIGRSVRMDQIFNSLLL